MSTFRRSARAAIVVAGIVLAGCGGDDDLSDLDDDAVEDPTDTAAVDEPPIAADADDADDEADDDGEPDGSPDGGGESGAPVPIARFAAHGPGEPHTIAPLCADGVETLAGEVFRFTPPVEWTQMGSSGGSGAERVELDTADGVRITVIESAYDYDTEAISMWEVVGPTGVDVDLGGESVPMMEVAADGMTGFAIVDLAYLGPLAGVIPGVAPDDALGTVAVVANEPDRPTPEEAEQLLSTVRVERCDAVSQALIWGPAMGVHLVPRFEPDPLGKPYPDQPQPAYVPGESPLAAYSLEQIAYLLPVETSISMCAAERAKAMADAPMGHLFVFRPTGTFKDDFLELIAPCL